MAIGIRFSPISLAKVCFNIRNFIKVRFNTQKLYPYKTKYMGVRFGIYHRSELEWLRDFRTFVPDDDCLENLINDIADSQYSTIINKFYKTEKTFTVPFVGRFYLTYTNDVMLKFNDYDPLTTVRYDRETFYEEHKTFFDRVFTDRFLKTSDKAAYYELSTKRFADILRRGLPQIYGRSE